MESSALGVMQNWVEGINSGDFERVITLYAKRAQLLPTFSSEIRATPAGIRAYFENVATAESVSVKILDDSVAVEKLAADCFAISGLYDWCIVKEGKADEVSARFTCIVSPGKAAPLLHQHSSVVP